MLVLASQAITVRVSHLICEAVGRAVVRPSPQVDGFVRPIVNVTYRFPYFAALLQSPNDGVNGRKNILVGPNRRQRDARGIGDVSAQE